MASAIPSHVEPVSLRGILLFVRKINPEFQLVGEVTIGGSQRQHLPPDPSDLRQLPVAVEAGKRRPIEDQLPKVRRALVSNDRNLLTLEIWNRERDVVHSVVPSLGSRQPAFARTSLTSPQTDTRARELPAEALDIEQQLRGRTANPRRSDTVASHQQVV